MSTDSQPNPSRATTTEEQTASEMLDVVRRAFGRAAEGWKAGDNADAGRRWSRALSVLSTSFGAAVAMMLVEGWRNGAAQGYWRPGEVAKLRREVRCAMSRATAVQISAANQIVNEETGS